MDAGELLARNVRRLRAAKGWSQEEAAAASSIHPTYWSQIETAKRNITVRVVGKVARGLGVGVAELFCDEASSIPQAADQ